MSVVSIHASICLSVTYTYLGLSRLLWNNIPLVCIVSNTGKMYLHVHIHLKLINCLL
jgi:uncharacterized membrane protein